MAHIGETIRALRKEQHLTQEGLAELLHITPQSVSKWERGTAYPDLTQLVPLARIFGVSTDVLLDNGTGNENDAIDRILDEAQSYVRDAGGCVTTAGLYRAWQCAQTALGRYPNHPWLLMYALEVGLMLDDPQGAWFDASHDAALYAACIRLANRVFAYVPNTNDKLRAHMILLLLHTGHGDMDAARRQLDVFPERADMTLYRMRAWIAEGCGDIRVALADLRRDTMYHFEALLDNALHIGKLSQRSSDWDDAVAAYRAVFALLEAVFDGEAIPPLHLREDGDCYDCLVDAETARGNPEAVAYWREKKESYPVYHDAPETPLLRGVEEYRRWLEERQ